ncbi:MAG: cupin domain-containing protein [Acidobacteriota bacterium]|nr:cupin domain-containing protein [Acidobacteriota bacterium]
MNRREFNTLLPMAMALGSVSTLQAEAQTTPAHALQPIASGVYPPGAPHGAATQRVSHPYLTGLLTAGDVRLEIHETTQEPGAPHEAIGTHLHNEIWLVREGTVELTTNGVARRMVAGDVGICIAGDKHFIANVGETRATYFVVTVGPPTE